MKASELRKYIREEIIEILSEETTFIDTKGGDTEVVDADAKQIAALKSDPNITGIKTAKGKEIKEDEDEPTDADLRKSDSVAKVASELARVTREMKKHLEMYKDAQGKQAKDAALRMLKKLTAEKKALEKQL